MREYQGDTGKVEFDDEARLFHGEVSNTRDMITSHGRSADELESALPQEADRADPQSALFATDH